MSGPIVLLLLAAGAQPAQPPHPAEVTGIVVDASGAAIAGAAVSAGGRETTTDTRGRFSLVVAQPEPTLRVRADGFAQYAGRVRAGVPVRVTMHPAGVAEAITVTAARSSERLSDAATASTVIAAPVLLTSAPLAADDALRAVPGFSLFRRSSSRVANPTTQGASLRGLAASGASRALVLADGVPLNDPYGGWVYWNRVPLVAIDRIETVRGGSSAELYGSESPAGAIQIVAIEPRSRQLRASLEAGEHGLARGSAFAGLRTRTWSAFVSGERMAFDGYPIVAAAERGPMDVPAGVRYSSGLVAATRHGDGWSLGLRAGALDEDRANGTPLQTNDTNLWSVAARARAVTGSGAWTFAGFGGTVDYDQSFSAVSADRASERLTARQRVPSDHAGGSAQWAGAWRGRALVAGGEVRRAGGGQAPETSGDQAEYAAYAQAVFQPAERATLMAGARAGLWSTTPSDGFGSTRRRAYVMPRLALAWSLTSRVSVNLSWTAPGRSPTLNELYRDFQVGNILTRANPGLRPESVKTLEGGALLRAAEASLRIVGFWTGVDDAIANVTTGADGGRIFRQRRNAGEIRARGLEVEGEWRPASWSALVASLTFLDSRFTASEEPGLAGRRVPQVPRWQGAVSVRLTPRRMVATLDWRGVGLQYDDDLNRFSLRRAGVLDAYAGLALGRVQPFGAVENLFDVEVDVGRTPVRTVGTPRSARLGVRVFIP
ncbi:MAG TPA: TonB-dependent receptor [Vicinamibacterales bacterium]|nr:TonB-dependent receptor [Vicinamibacterales bacterium]